MPAPRGQNFLHQPAWQRRVAAAVAATSSDAVLEIGGGLGDVSEILARGAGRLTVVEVDARLAEGLRKRLSGLAGGHVHVIEADILTLDLSRLAAEMAAPKLRVFGNLPYYITSPILFHLFHFAAAIGDATVMMQREVADRVLAKPGGEFGLLSAAAQFHSRPRRLFDLPPGAFRPAPRVHSSLLRLEMAPQATLGVEPAAFERFLRIAFASKRKLLSNNLAAAYPAPAVGAALAAAGVPAHTRAEQLGVTALAAVHRWLAAEESAAPGFRG